MTPSERLRLGVLFVCTGNICRSPTAEGVFRTMVEKAGLADRLRIDSAATHGYHPGKPPDTRAQAAALRRGYDLSAQRARVVEPEDLDTFDYVLAMAEDHLAHLQGLARDSEQVRKLHLFATFAPELGRREVPDPYYGGIDGFDAVLDMVETACAALLEDVRRRLQ